MTEHGLDPERLAALLEEQGIAVSREEAQGLIQKWVQSFPEMHVFFGHFFGHLFVENKKLRHALRCTKGDLRAVVRELNKVERSRSIGEDIDTARAAVRPALAVLRQRREKRKKK